MDLGLAGKSVLVTGASRGIGRSLALDFAREGCRVGLVARNLNQLQEVLSAMGGEACGHHAYAVDLMPEGTPTEAWKALTQVHGDFDIVVHNVGGTLQIKDCLAPMSDWFKVLRFNAGIAIELNAVVAPVMQKKQWGRIIHISSISGESLRGSGPYAAAKAYLNAYTKVLGRALAKSGIVVSALLPGAIDAPGGHWDIISKTNPAMKEDFLRHHHAIGRLGQANEISPFALFMASQWATFAQGCLLPIDGGTM